MDKSGFKEPKVYEKIESSCFFDFLKPEMTIFLVLRHKKALFDPGII